MAHVALVDSKNRVKAVHVINNSDLPDNGEFSPAVEKAAQEYQSSLGLDVEGHRWLLTSYNDNFRGCFAGVGSIYDEELDIFLPIDHFE